MIGLVIYVVWIDNPDLLGLGLITKSQAISPFSYQLQKSVLLFSKCQEASARALNSSIFLKFI
jgi:hypothetical protein